MRHALGIPLVLALGCVSTESAFEASKQAYGGELALRYPTGVLIEQLPCASFDRWDLSSPPPDRFAELGLADARGDSGVSPASCVFGEVLRPGPASSLGAFGFWQDYVFLDSHDRVLVAFRRWVD